MPILPLIHWHISRCFDNDDHKQIFVVMIGRTVCAHHEDRITFILIVWAEIDDHVAQL